MKSVEVRQRSAGYYCKLFLLHSLLFMFNSILLVNGYTPLSPSVITLLGIRYLSDKMNGWYDVLPSRTGNPTAARAYNQSSQK